MPKDISYIEVVCCLHENIVQCKQRHTCKVKLSQFDKISGHTSMFAYSPSVSYNSVNSIKLQSALAYLHTGRYTADKGMHFLALQIGLSGLARLQQFAQPMLIGVFPMALFLVAQLIYNNQNSNIFFAQNLHNNG